MKALYILCDDKEKDLVGYNVSNYFKEHYDLIDCATKGDLASVYTIDNHDQHQYIIMITPDHVMHNATKYLDYIKDNFSDVDIMVHINRHSGATAPDPVFSVHQVGDIASSTYLKHDPKYATNLIKGLEKIVKQEGLDTYTVETETVHYSGVISDNDPRLLLEYGINNIDLEIGSSVEAFNNPKAVEIIAKSIFTIFENTNDQRLHVLYIGGAHFESTYTNAVLSQDYPIYLSHQLSGVWVSQLDQDKLVDNLQTIIDQALIPYDAIVFHSGVKKLKEYFQQVADTNKLPLFKYNALKNIENSEMKKLFK